MKYYFIFYVNLSFSALSRDDQAKVVDLCLVKLISLAEAGFRFGIQMSGVSLEIVKEYRPDLIEALKDLIAFRKVDFIGNGYSQIIQPLFPYKMNDANQFFGLETYKNLLGFRPHIATVNEMALSEGSLRSFVANQYDTVLMEYENLSRINGLDDANQFTPTQFSIEDKELSLIWCHTVAFQKFQKYVHGELSLDNYVRWLKEFTSDKEGVVCLYCSDAEIFDFRPKRYGTEIEPEYNEWSRIEVLLSLLDSETILPSKVLDYRKGVLKKITTAEYPIVVKKQEKYNINRWAITGRDDQKLNTFCYASLEALKNRSFYEVPELYKDLLKLASSDLRTHIESGRWFEAQKIRRRLANILDIKEYRSVASPLEVDTSNVVFNTDRGLNIVAFPAREPVLVHTPLGEFKDIKLMADFYSGFILIERPGERKISDLDYKRSVNSELLNIYTHSDGTILKKEILDVSDNVLRMQFSVECPTRIRQQIRIANFTLSHRFFDFDSFSYSCNLGGDKLENFALNKVFDQDQNLNLNTFGKNGFTPTDGRLIFKDKNRSVTFTADPSECFYLVRMSSHIEYGKQLVRLSFIVQDIDETFIECDSANNFRLTVSVSVSR